MTFSYDDLPPEVAAQVRAAADRIRARLEEQRTLLVEARQLLATAEFGSKSHASLIETVKLLESFLDAETTH